MTSPAWHLIRLALLAMAVLALAAMLWFRVGAPMLNRSIADDLGQGDYALAATDGSTFTEATLRGAPSAVFFGYTHCPDVCPTTMGEIADWQEQLGGKAKLRVFFVTVDPERDGVDMLRDYVSWIPGVVGITGTRAEIDKAIRAFRIYANKVPGSDGAYWMDHTAYVMLFDANGRFDQIIAYQEPPETALPKLRKLLGLPAS